MRAEEFRPIWLKKIGYSDMIELELARLSCENIEDVATDDEFAEAYAAEQNKLLKEANIDFKSTLEHLKPHQDQYGQDLIDEQLNKH